MTILGPRGWACQKLVAADGTRAIEVYPPGGAATDSSSPTASVQSVYAADDYTGRGPGAQLVCAYFPASSANAFLDRSSQRCPLSHDANYEILFLVERHEPQV